MAKTIEDIKTILVKEKARLQGELENFKDEESLSFKDSTGEISSYDNHPADQGSETYEREKDIGLRDNTLILLEKVNKALQLINQAEYGICQICGQKINQERLEAIPYAIYCNKCSEEEEPIVTEDRPIEEKAIDNPFASGFNDNTDKVEYDAEDTWQDVAQYGTSNTSQDIPEAAASNSEKAYIDSEESETVSEVEQYGTDDVIEHDDEIKTAEDEEDYTNKIDN